MTPGLEAALQRQRAQRGFEAAAVLEAKIEVLEAYMRAWGLSACVVAVSGGIDSAVVLALAARAAARKGSVIRRVVPLLAPVFDDEAASDQAEATERGLETCASQGLAGQVLDLTDAHAALRSEVERALGIRGQGWAAGQLVATTRTPALYYATSLLAQQGFGAILLGTTNRDEGAYLGYVGKSSDGMVDVQLISDLHKSEVRALARLLGLPASVTGAEPTGNMFDGRSDVQVFGAPYDFVELYLGHLCLDQQAQGEMLEQLGADDRLAWDEMAAHLEHLHDYNAHKYLAGSPAVHLDLLRSAVPGGWDVRAWHPATEEENA